MSPREKGVFDIADLKEAEPNEFFTPDLSEDDVIQ